MIRYMFSTAGALCGIYLLFVAAPQETAIGLQNRYGFWGILVASINIGLLIQYIVKDLKERI